MINFLLGGLVIDPKDRFQNFNVYWDFHLHLLPSLLPR
ncbi:hypothetical protein CDS [Bradyrhizobium sp.]|nr:hypothetical protein CDS [Bradyrhizobium sp.]